MSSRIVNSVQFQALAASDPTFVGNLSYLDPEGYHVLTPILAAHNDQPEVRCTADIKIVDQDSPATGMLIVQLSVFNKLPTYEEWKASHSD